MESWWFGLAFNARSIKTTVSETRWKNKKNCIEICHGLWCCECFLQCLFLLSLYLHHLIHLLPTADQNADQNALRAIMFWVFSREVLINYTIFINTYMSPVLHWFLTFFIGDSFFSPLTFLLTNKVLRILAWWWHSTHRTRSSMEQERRKKLK